jgi:hypothetical protein
MPTPAICCTLSIVRLTVAALRLAISFTYIIIVLWVESMSFVCNVSKSMTDSSPDYRLYSEYALSGKTGYGGYLCSKI